MSRKDLSQTPALSINPKTHIKSKFELSKTRIGIYLYTSHTMTTKFHEYLYLIKFMAFLARWDVYGTTGKN
jgi:hypothetical protein